ncbi:MAG: FtsX-like permease family protein [Candidatus Bathyarchaeia archaeon]
MRSGRGLSLAVAILLCLLVAGAPPAVGAENTLSGLVTDDLGQPLRATVATFTSLKLARTATAGDDGRFSVAIDPNVVSVMLFYDDPSTTGFDYGPALVKLGTVTELTVQLEPSASIRLLGDILFVETENIPTGSVYQVVDANGVVINPSGFPLSFGTKQEETKTIPGLPASTVVVPAGTTFSLSLGSTLLVASKIVTRTIISDPQAPLERGALVEFDVRGPALRYNLQVVEKALADAELGLANMERLGFYVVREKGIFSTAEASFAEGSSLYESGRYVEGFDSAKLSYIDAKRTQADLANLYVDASSSVYILIGFLAVASVTAAFLLADSLGRQVLVGVGVYGGALLFLYRVYPGTAATTPQSFALVAAASFLVVVGVAASAPRLLGSAGGGGKVSLRAILVPVASIAKRSLRRRRLRFLLTLVSLTVLVMSFVALTSLSEGYGLISAKVSDSPYQHPGVMLRSSTWTEADPSFILFADADVAWLARQPGVEAVSLKVENTPQLRAIATVGGNRIFTIIGINATRESRLLPLSSILSEGELPGPGGVALSRGLVDRLGLKLGDPVKIRDQDLRLVGVFDDFAMSGFTDVDGSRYVMDKLVNLAGPGDPPYIERATTESTEVALIDASNAASMQPLGVTRIAVLVDAQAQDAFAENIALGRGYQTWSASARGLLYTSLGSYLEGKGLPLVIPWAIVVLNVVVTMLNSLFERRREISILSSVGLNPAEIASIFVAEASITGFIAGGLGYLAGLGFYSVMPLIGLSLEVHQKISAVWSLAAIGIAISAVLVGAFAALRSSVVITPSLTRRWRIEEAGEAGAPWAIPVPMKLDSAEVDGFVEYLLKRLRGFETDQVRKTANIKTETQGDARVVTFIFKSPQSTTGNFYTNNTVRVEPRDGGYEVRLSSYGALDWAHETGSLIRLIAMEWSDRER